MIPLLDLQAQYQSIQEPLERAVLDVLRSGNYVLGEPVYRFERDLAAFCGAAEAVAVNSGTSALHLALLAAGIGPGDEVVTVPLTFVATAAAILYAGATPVLADVAPDTYTMDAAAFEAAITPRTRAVVPVHLHGRLADMKAIGEVARRHGVLVIEDAAQAHGAERDGCKACTFGLAGCLSFYPGKNLGACGEGGAVVTNDPDLAERVRRLRDWGQDGKYKHMLRGFNARMDTVQAAVLAVKLPFLQAWTEARQQIAAQYDSLLAGTGAGLPAPAGADHVRHAYVVRLAERDAVRERLSQAGVGTGIHYPVPVHRQPAYAGLAPRAASFPVSEALAREFLSLPIYPELVASQVSRVADALAAALERDVEAA